VTDPDVATDDFDDIYDESAPQHSPIAVTDFQPWHHPRKHWARLNHLCHNARRLIRDTDFQDDFTLRYLTLPGEAMLDVQSLQIVAKGGGEELLDVQALGGAIDKPGVKLKYIGFNNYGTNETRRNKQAYAESIIRDEDTIHLESKIINEQVQKIANIKSKAYADAENNGPYNIINIDLCGCLAAVPPEREATYFQAIGQILELQKRNMSKPFMMLITTKTEPHEFDPASLRGIISVYGDNFRENAEFKSQFEECLQSQADDLLGKLANGEAVPQEKLNMVFGVGLGKWLLQLMKPSAPHWDVSLEDICCYSIGEYEPNMLSLAFRFTRVVEPVNDRAGLFISALDGSTNTATEEQLALAMLKKVAHIVNVDTLLDTDITTRNKLISQAGKFLEKAGYSAEKYTKWANELFINLTPTSVSPASTGP